MNIMFYSAGLAAMATGALFGNRTDFDVRIGVICCASYINYSDPDIRDRTYGTLKNTAMLNSTASDPPKYTPHPINKAPTAMDKSYS